jgi:hypothetical protein
VPTWLADCLRRLAAAPGLPGRARADAREQHGQQCEQREPILCVRRDLGSPAAQVAATAYDDCARGDQARLPTRSSREQQTTPGLSSGLIHPRPGPFTDGRGPAVRAGQGRWRPVVNSGAQSSKACEGATPPRVQIPPPPPLTCDDASPVGMLDRGGHGGGLIFGPQLVSVERAQVPLPSWMGHQFSPCTAVGVISDEALPAPYRCRQEPLPDIVAGLVVVPSSVVYCAPDLPIEPTYTPVKRARYCSGLAVAGPRPPGYPPTFRPHHSE